MGVGGRFGKANTNRTTNGLEGKREKERRIQRGKSLSEIIVNNINMKDMNIHTNEEQMQAPGSYLDIGKIHG